MPTKIYEVTLEDFARSFGTTADDFSEDLRAIITETDFSYGILDGKERDEVMLDVLKKIETDQQIIGAPERRNAWEKGWDENLKGFIESGHDLNKLVPRFIRPNQPVRLNQNYVMHSNPTFELD